MPVMVQPWCFLLVAAAFAVAPYQCSSDRDPAHAVEETPGEALYQLAGELKRAGDRPGWRHTLRYLIGHYPSSRFAVMAKQDLGELGAGGR